MKAIIYAGIGLLSIASVYGVADYYQSKKEGTLKKLYQEEVEAVPVSASKELDKTAGIIKEAVLSKKETAVESKKVRTKSKAARKIKLEDYSRGEIPEIELKVEEKKPEPVKVEAVPVKTSLSAIPETKATLKISEEKEAVFEPSRFSRASLKRPVKKVKPE